MRLKNSLKHGLVSVVLSAFATLSSPSLDAAVKSKNPAPQDFAALRPDRCVEVMHDYVKPYVPAEDWDSYAEVADYVNSVPGLYDSSTIVCKDAEGRLDLEDSVILFSRTKDEETVQSPLSHYDVGRYPYNGVIYMSVFSNIMNLHLLGSKVWESPGSFEEALKKFSLLYVNLGDVRIDPSRLRVMYQDFHRPYDPKNFKDGAVSSAIGVCVLEKDGRFTDDSGHESKSVASDTPDEIEECGAKRRCAEVFILPRGPEDDFGELIPKVRKRIGSDAFLVVPFYLFAGQS